MILISDVQNCVTIIVSQHTFVTAHEHAPKYPGVAVFGYRLTPKYMTRM